LYFSTVRPLTRRADRACTVSQFEKNRMVRLGFSPADRIDVVPYGIDDVFGRHDPNSASHDVLHAFGIQAPFLLYVGRLTVRKNVDTLIRAMECVQTSPLELVIVGAADRTAGDLPALAAELGVAHRVRFLGPIYDERLASLYSAATAFCFPTWDESYGLPPLEAMAAGTPCIVSDIEVLREMYRDAAVFANPNDPKDFARAIDSVIADPARRAALAANGRTRASEFTWDHTADLLLTSAKRAVEARQ
jgi:glycosyltransferase involved in cell wall biosynthesis